MPVSADDILSFASSWLESADCECQLRGIVGRSYYAAYHRAYDFHCQLPQPGLSPEKGGVHEALWHALTNPTVGDPEQKRLSKAVGYVGRDLHMKRIVADYHRDATVTPIDAQQAVSQAQRLFTSITG